MTTSSPDEEDESSESDDESESESLSITGLLDSFEFPSWSGCSVQSSKFWEWFVRFESYRYGFSEWILVKTLLSLVELCLDPVLFMKTCSRTSNPLLFDFFICKVLLLFIVFFFFISLPHLFILDGPTIMDLVFLNEAPITMNCLNSLMLAL